MAPMTLHKKLMAMPLYRGLRESEVGALCEISEETTLRRGEWLFKEGDPGNALWVVLEGTVEVTKKNKPLDTVSEGAILGEMSLIGTSPARTASAQALTEVTLLRLPAARFSKLLKSDATAALKLVCNVAQVFAQRLLLMDEKLVGSLGPGKKREELKDFQQILSKWQF